MTKGYIYFIADLSEKKVKIGYSRKVEQRLKTLQTGYPNKLTILKTIIGNQQEERKYHALFSWYKLKGEWFTLSPEIEEFISR